ncbi:MAG: hypothetical protein LM583_01475 [Desulfurococcaceae archaeon]|jgi:hypothetical protein|nr:hypothetical protein [Desulfurococcaceae archaeon]
MHMLKYSIVLYSAGESIASRLIPRVTEYTLKVFRKSVFVALSLALQRFFEGDYRRGIRHITML